MTVRQYPEVPLLWKGRDQEEHLYQIALALRGIMVGQVNTLLEVTLAAGATSTEVSDPRIGATCKAFLTARSATAAAATGVWIETAIGKFTIHHDSSAATDRDFGLLFSG